MAHFSTLALAIITGVKASKLRIVDAHINLVETMKKLLEEGLDCDCMSPDECVVLVNYDSIST
jgi:hypothetical protein